MAVKGWIKMQSRHPSDTKDENIKLVLFSSISGHFCDIFLWNPFPPLSSDGEIRGCCKTLSPNHFFQRVTVDLFQSEIASGHINHLYYHYLKTFVRWLLSSSPSLSWAPITISWQGKQGQLAGCVGGSRNAFNLLHLLTSCWYPIVKWVPCFQRMW